MSLNPAQNEFANQPVPPGIGISGWRIALIKIGVIIALPAFIMGAELGFTLGWRRSLLAFICGAIILFVIAAATGTTGAKSRLPTSILIEFAFGRLGARAVNLVLAFTLMGWFGVTAELFGETLEQIVSDMTGVTLGSVAYIIFGGLLMIITTIFGIRGLQRLADLAVPLLLFALALIAYLACQRAVPGVFTESPLKTVPIGVGISAVVGSMAAGVTIFPDLCRFAHSPAHGRTAAFLSMGIGIPVVLGLAALSSVAAQESNLLAIMVSLGLGVPALLFLVFAAWTTNSGNLYSSSLMLATIFRLLNQKLLVLIVGVIGIIMAVFGIGDYLIPYLLIVGYSIPPIASVYVIDFFLFRRGILDIAERRDLPALRIPALAAWSVGVAVAALSANGVISVTTVPTCDSILTSLILYVGFFRLGWVKGQASPSSDIDACIQQTPP